MTPAGVGGGRYRAYVVRCWQESAGWRFSLEAIGDRKQHGYADLAALIKELQGELDSFTASGGAAPPAPGPA